MEVAVQTALARAYLDDSNLNPELLSLVGMSGKKYRHFINNLISSLGTDARYLEVGCWAGSTLCSALNGNSAEAVGIDNWSEFGGPRDTFIYHAGRYIEPFSRLKMIERDFRQVDFNSLGKFNVYLYDGPHSAKDQFDGIWLALGALTNQFVLIVDDWNWKDVREGTVSALSKLQLKVLHRWEIRTTDDDTHPQIAGADSDWHNGYFIAVVEK